jgi:hypothetical protein
MVTKQLCVDTIGHNSTITLVLQVIGTAELGEAPEKGSAKLKK